MGRITNCLTCGKKFYMAQELIDKGYREFCSSICFRSSLYAKIKRVRLTDKYTRWKYKVLLRDDFTCKNCGVKFNVDKGILVDVHHIIPLAELVANGRVKKYYDVNNGKTLCKPCHNAITFKKEVG